MTRVQELCRKLRPVLGAKVDRLWMAYLAQTDATGKADIEQTLELLAVKHLGQGFEPDRSPFPPPEQQFAQSGDIPVGDVCYGDNRSLFPFQLRSQRLKEHILIAGRSGSGKTNLTFVLMRGILQRGIKVLALDWKRGYRDLLTVQPDLRVYTIGRDVAPFRFNPLIPPPGCEPNVWIKLIVDVIASAYLGGEGVISLLVAGLDKLYRDAGLLGPQRNPANHQDQSFGGPTSAGPAFGRWPTVQDLLAWLRSAKLKGRAAMWQASAERILLAMTYGEFGAVINTQDNGHVRDLLNHNVVLEMDGLSSDSDRKLFSEALTLYLYRYRLSQGPRRDLTNLIVLEEAHNLLLRRAAEARESMLETSIRMIRQYGMGYVFVDQSASLLSKVAFANSYATLALSQKLRSDVQTIAGAMNLTEEQRQAMSTLPIGSAVVRLADQHPEPFLVRVPRFPIEEGSVTDDTVRYAMSRHEIPRDPTTDPAYSTTRTPAMRDETAITPIPPPDKNKDPNGIAHPPTPVSTTSRPSETKEPGMTGPMGMDPSAEGVDESIPQISRDEQRFLVDVATHPLSTTVTRYQRLNLSRRRGNAIRQQLDQSGIIRAVSIPTRSGQVVLYDLTDIGRSLCEQLAIDPGHSGSRPRESLEHRYWVHRAAEHFKKEDYEVALEVRIDGNGIVDLVATRLSTRVAIEIETGKSNIKANIENATEYAFDRIVLVATSPSAVSACKNAIANTGDPSKVELLTWLDIS